MPPIENQKSVPREAPIGPIENTVIFVTGASGFIGGKLVERLLEHGRSVRVLSRRPLPHFAARGVDVIPGDLLDPAALRRGCDGADTVFHVASRVGIWGPKHEFHRVNVEGTRAVLAACRASRVPRLVYTSSPSVVFNGGDLSGVDESAPYVTDCPCAYPTTKAAAEREILAANSRTLATIALRPHLVWGPGDRNVVPRVLALARQRRLKIIGAGRNRVDLTHIANVVDAHLLAEAALAKCHVLSDTSPDAAPGVCNVLRYKPREATQEVCHVIRDKPADATAVDCNLIDDKPAGQTAAGRAYFITNGEPVLLWDWINALLRALGIPSVEQHVSLRTAYAAGAVCETLWTLLPLRGEPPMTRFAAKELATDHWFKIAAARRDLGYAPRVSMADGTNDLIAHLSKATGV